MKSHIEIGGTTPADEDCVQVGDAEYSLRARREARAFIAQIHREFPEIEKLEGRVLVKTKSNRHDMGTYLSVIAEFDDEDEDAVELAYDIETRVSTEWDDDARKELGLEEKNEEVEETEETEEDDSFYFDNDEMLESYLQAALWSSTDADDKPLDDEGYSFTEKAEEFARSEVNEFVSIAGDRLRGLNASHVGHDFWLTRNRHGAGFWDGDYDEKLGEELTNISHLFGDSDIYAETIDDEKIANFMDDNYLSVVAMNSKQYGMVAFCIVRHYEGYKVRVSFAHYDVELDPRKIDRHPASEDFSRFHRVYDTVADIYKEIMDFSTELNSKK